LLASRAVFLARNVTFHGWNASGRARNAAALACCGAFQVSNVVFLGWTARELTWNASAGTMQ
jgi:hypothetical protein